MNLIGDCTLPFIQLIKNFLKTTEDFLWHLGRFNIFHQIIDRFHLLCSSASYTFCSLGHLRSATDLHLEVPLVSLVAVLQGCVYPSSDSRPPVSYHAL